MATIQKLKCKTCGVEFEFDPKNDQNIIKSLNCKPLKKINKELEVTAYLDCSNFHINPYRVKKDY